MRLHPRTTAPKYLKVVSTSDLGGAAELQVLGFGRLSLDHGDLGGIAPSTPETVTVPGGVSMSLCL